MTVDQSRYGCNYPGDTRYREIRKSRVALIVISWIFFVVTLSCSRQI